MAFEGDDVIDAAAALEGARHILVERAAEDAELVGAVREKFWADGSLRTMPWSEDSAKSADAQKFRDYFDFAESLQTMPSHRVLAVMRGEKEKVLGVTFDAGEGADSGSCNHISTGQPDHYCRADRDLFRHHHRNRSAQLPVEEERRSVQRGELPRIRLRPPASPTLARNSWSWSAIWPGAPPQQRRPDRQRRAWLCDHLPTGQSVGYCRPDRNVLRNRNGTAPLSYQWRKDGSAIGGATAPAIRLLPPPSRTRARSSGL